MTRRLEDVVDLLRRTGAGAAPVSQIRAEMRLRDPQSIASTASLRALAENSNGRLLFLDAEVDAPPCRPHAPGRLLVAWIVLMWPEDEPDQSPLASYLWRSLSALAEEVDLESRPSVCRWALQARQAQAALRRAVPATRHRR